ncbi:hypothetical protein [Flavobacterium sp. UBA7680]|uniref:hypothetical protein n=1 Tax=Flavobacterium sp. UBA7680 TaxID=1946559 RepID=UPI0025BE7CDB|nr:hypothetical protein [Flavobacterium sp. UBA7680]
MKKAVLLLIFMTLTSFIDVADNVYICNSKGAKKYHLKEFCRGLGACKHEIIKVTLKQAKERGLDLCGWED